ncbi:MAG TPA: hypothetical protein PLU42_09330, partial [Spirochaetota bacterium]|nr:hypothetical protein [Spirochaetota bacterium]
MKYKKPGTIVLIAITVIFIHATLVSDTRHGTWVIYNVPASPQSEKTIPVKIYFPKSYSDSSRVIIAFHEYDGSMNSWQNNTSIAYYANQYNMVIVCPHMPRS